MDHVTRARRYQAHEHAERTYATGCLELVVGVAVVALWVAVFFLAWSIWAS